jgi:lysophospholipase L1-like esterase
MTLQRTLCCAALSFIMFMMAVEAGLTASGKDLSQGGTVLLLGDSILDCHEGDKRIEVVMRRLLEEKTPHAQWMIYNEAHGGEYIGPKEGTPTGVSEPLFTTDTTGRYFEIVKRHPRVDAVIVNYAGNDSKVYPPATFRKRLEFLGDLLERTYHGALIIFSTTMYVDPAHAAPYHRDDPKVQGFRDGSPRNDYFEPYNKEIRQFTATQGYLLVDTFRRIESETQRGNWDFRVRGPDGDGDPNDDAKHQGDMAWFDNVHPNDQGTRLIAEGYVEALTKSH